MKRIAFYGGSFDPVHRGHLAIAGALIEQFELDEFVFIPAFHAPHKLRKQPTSAYDRYAMLCLITNASEQISVSKMEIEAPGRPYTFETLATLRERLGDTEIFFVMGADSWMEITTWRKWEEVLTLANHIVITRPGFDIGFSHVTDDIRARIVDLRRPISAKALSRKTAMSIQPLKAQSSNLKNQIFITDAVNISISATEIRNKIGRCDPTWRDDVASEVAKYVEKYQIYS